MMYVLITRVRAPSQLVFLGLELTRFLTKKPQPHLALYLQRFGQNKLYFFSDLLINLQKYLLEKDLPGPASLFFEKAVGRRMNYQKKKEDENRELQKRMESTRGVKVQKLEMREPLLGKKSSECSECLVVVLVPVWTDWIAT